MTTDLVLGPDASHVGQGHIDSATWQKILADPAAGFALAKASQGTTFTDPESLNNLAAFKAAADRGDIDWYGSYLWPSNGSISSQISRFNGAVKGFTDDPRWRWMLDVEGGSAATMDALAKSLTDLYGAERGIIYGGAYLIGTLKNPTAKQCPNAAAVGGFIRSAYVNDEPGHGANTIPNLFKGKGPTHWQYTDGVWGPSDLTRFPRELANGLWHGDLSCFWEPTAGCTNEEWIAKTGGEMNFTEADYDKIAKRFGVTSGADGMVHRIAFMKGVDDAMQNKNNPPTAAAGGVSAKEQATDYARGQAHVAASGGGGGGGADPNAVHENDNVTVAGSDFTVKGKITKS